MPRPTIVIGLGGTGQWVLSWLKKDLIETYETLDDKPIRLLLMDVATFEANVGQAAIDIDSVDAGGQYSSYTAGIDPSREFIQLPTDKKVNIMRMIDDGVVSGKDEYSHIGSWYCGGYFPTGITLADGAGKFRQLGRLSLIYGLNQNRTNDEVYAKLSRMVEDVARPVQPGGPSSVDIHIVCSLGGGSGSGLFLDVAFLMRKIVPDNIQANIMGFLAMANVFNTGFNLADELRIKNFTVWRELNRMMTITRNNPMKIEWGRQSDMFFKAENPPFDHVYLVEQARQDHLRGNPQRSVFPMIAEAISFYIDEHAGTAYVQNVRVNLNNEKSKAPLAGQPIFSTLRVHSWKLPVYHYRSLLRHKLAKAYLDQLLAVESYEETLATGQKINRYRLKNQENCAGRAHEILDSNLPSTGNTEFLRRIGQLITTSKLEMDQRFVEFQHSDLLAFFVEMPDTEDGRAIASELHDMVNYGPPNVQASGDLNIVRTQLIRAHDELYGYNDLGGTYSSLYGDFTGKPTGDLYRMLERVESFQLRVFSERIRVWMQRELNQNKAGLACVKSAIHRLLRDLERVIEFFERIEQSKPLVSELKQGAIQAYHDAVQSIQGTGCIGRILGSPKKVVANWYEWESSYNRLQRDIRGVQRIISTLHQMKTYVEEVALESVVAMEQQIVTDNDVDRIVGLYRGILESQSDEIKRHEYDQNIPIMTLIGDQSFSALDIQSTHQQKIDELVQNTEWVVDENLRLTVRIKLNQNNIIELNADMRDPNKTRELVQRLLVGLADRIIFEDQKRIADYLLDSNYRQRFESELRSIDSTLFTKSTSHAPERDVITFYLRAQVDEGQRRELDQIIRSLNINPGSPNSVEVQNSESSNKIVVFRAEELLLPQNFAEWDECSSRYKKNVSGDAQDRIYENYERIRCDHLFAGEKNALQLEKRYFEEHKVDFPILNFRLVHLLEQRQLLLTFLELWALRWIYIEYGSGDLREVVLQPERDAPEILISTSAERNKEFDMLSAIEVFAIKQRSERGASLPMERVSILLKEQIRDLTPEDRSLLRAFYNAEMYLSKEVYDFLSRQLQRKSPTETIAKEYREQRAQMLSNVQQQIKKDFPNYDVTGNHHSLMLLMAEDFCRTRADGAKLVTNEEAHLQALQFVFRYLLGELESKFKERRLS